LDKVYSLFLLTAISSPYRVSWDGTDSVICRLHCDRRSE